MFLFRRTFLAVVLILIGFSMHSSEAMAQSSDAADRASVIDAVKTIFVAAKADDLTQFHSVIAPGFYMYDIGARFDGDAIMKVIKSAHEAGNIFDWNVTDPDVHVTGNSAWIAYVNKGSVTKDSKTQQLQWLESAFLEKRNGAWKIVFMHSTQVPEVKKP